MMKTIEAIYEEGVLKPQEPVDLDDKVRVQVTIEVGEPTGKAFAHRRIRHPGRPPGGGEFDSGHTDTAEQAEELLTELGFGEDPA